MISCSALTFVDLKESANWEKNLASSVPSPPLTYHKYWFFDLEGFQENFF